MAEDAIHGGVSKQKVVCRHPIEPLVSVGDFVVNFGVGIAIKRSVLQIKVDALWVHVHSCDDRAHLNFVFRVLDSNQDW